MHHLLFQILFFFIYIHEICTSEENRKEVETENDKHDIGNYSEYYSMLEFFSIFNIFFLKQKEIHAEKISWLLRKIKIKAFNHSRDVLTDIIDRFKNNFHELEEAIFKSIFFDLSKILTGIMSVITKIRQICKDIDEDLPLKNLDIKFSNFQNKFKRFFLHKENNLQRVIYKKKVINLFYSKLSNEYLEEIEFISIVKYKEGKSDIFPYNISDKEIRYKTNNTELNKDNEDFCYKIDILDKKVKKSYFAFIKPERVCLFFRKVILEIDNICNNTKEINVDISYFESLKDIYYLFYLKTTNSEHKPLLYEIICYELEQYFYCDLFAIKECINNNFLIKTNTKFIVTCDIIKTIKRIDFIFRDVDIESICEISSLKSKISPGNRKAFKNEESEKLLGDIDLRRIYSELCKIKSSIIYNICEFIKCEIYKITKVQYDFEHIKKEILAYDPAENPSEIINALDKCSIRVLDKVKLEICDRGLVFYFSDIKRYSQISNLKNYFKDIS